MIDLSHLTEEEQVSIMRVLQRDAELRKVEEKRVRHVQESVKNEVQCKNMTGEWFYKAKAKRHKDTLHGAELIKASMRKKKPMTIYERLQSKELKENSKSFMNNIEKSVYVSPELSVFLEEPKLEDPHTSTTLHKNNSAPKPQPTPRQSTPSGKQRENPFNRTFLADDIPNGEKKSLQLVGTESVSVTPLAEKLSQPKENVSRLQTSSNEFLETKKPSLAEDGIYSEGHPVPKPRTISYKLQDSIPSSDQHHSAPGLMNQNGFNGNSTTPKKSILKHSPSSSSNDSEILLVSVQDSKRKIAASPQTIPEGLAEINTVVDNEELLAPNSLERLKQVRFSTNVDEKKISPTLEFYNENKSSKIGEGSLLDTDYSEETIEENADGMDNAREDESPDEANGFSAQSHLSFLSEDPLNMDQDDNVMSNSDFQSIPATSSHIANHTNNHLASSGSGKLTNRVREMDTGEILTENKVNRRLNSASNLANHSVDKQVPHTEFESPQVSNQQPAKIFQGKHVNFVVPLFKTASMEQRHAAPSAQSQMPDKYTAEHMKAADESISKVLDWFTRSEEMPSVNERLKEVEPPSEPIVENKLPLNAKPDTEFSHTESDIFTKSLQEMQNVNGEIQRSGEQGIQLKEVQTPTKVNIFHKSVIPEAIVLEEKSKMKTKNGFESTYPISENVIKSSNNQQQHIRLERDESKQGLLVSEKGRVEANVSADGESDSQATSNVNFFLATTNKNDIQVTESRSESTSLNPEESKTLPTSGVSDITEDALNAFQNLSSKHRTSYQENSFANAVFRKSAENEDTIDIKSSNYKSANKASNAVTTASLNSTFFDNGAEKELDRTKIKKQQSVDGNEHVTTTRENPFLEQARQGSNEHIDVPVYDGQSALRKNTTLNKAKTKSSLKQNEEETNVLQDKIHVKAIDLKQTLNNDENSTKVNFQLEKNDTNVIPKNEKPFTIVSIKKKICNTSDDPHQDLSHFTNLRNFWDKGTKTLDAELGLANTSDDKHSILKIATNTEQKMLLEAKPSITNYPDDLSKNESMKTEECHGPSVQERMQQILQQRESQPDKKRLNTKYFPKVLPTEPEEIKLKLKTANNALNKNELLSTSNDFQKHSSEVGESAQERIICDPKSQESNNLNIGLQWRHQEKDENETSLIEEQHKHERVLLSDNQTFMLSDESADRMINSQSLLEDINQSRPNTYSKIGNNKDDNISEKLLQSQIPNVLKPPEKSFQNENSSIKQISSKEVSSNEENLALFAGRSPLVEENDIPQKNLNNSESLDNMIHGNLKTVEEDKLSSIKGSKYNENLGIDLNKDNRGFDLQDQFQMELNLPSGTTRTSTFKENSDSPTKRSMESFKAGAQDNPDQDASSKNVLLDYSRGSDHLHAETWRSSLSEEEEGSSLALKRNSRTSETYKSLQDIHVISSRMPNTLDSTNQEMLLSADNVSSIPTTPENASLQSKRMKRLSKSVPAFPENDDADSMSEGSFQMDKHGTIASSLTNISGSSGMASRSSVSGSTMSIYSSDIGNIDVRGKIQFSLDYVDKLKEFHIFVVRCSDLAAAEEKKNRSDPYVKSYLLPDKIKTGKRKTTVKKRTLNPVYNEILRYKIDKASLMAQTLNLSVWHNDTFGRNSFLGEVEVELRKWDWSNKKMDWHDLKPRTISANRTGDKGSLKVAFRYIPQGYKGKKTGEVQIWVKEASNLPQIRPSRLDPFVKCFILPDTSRKSRQKTRVVKKSTNPVFNHTMVYDGFSTEDLKDACVELSVWDHDKLINHFLGGLRIGLGTGKSYGLTVDWMDSTEEEISVWDKMMTHPNTWVEDVLPLRMLMLSKMSGT